MSTVIFEENWRPLSTEEMQEQLEETEGKFYINKISSNYRPQKLARYSFKENLININDSNVLLGYKQVSSSPEPNSDFNLTGYIAVLPGQTYIIKAESGIDWGVDSGCYFNSNKGYSTSFQYSSNHGINTTITIPSNTYYIRLAIYKNAWGKVSFYRNVIFDREHKGMTPLNIIDNKEEELVYKDLKLEVFVKAEAEIKNFVQNFNLEDFENFPYSGHLGFNVYNENYYKKEYTWNNWVANQAYGVGARVHYSDGYTDGYYICRVANSGASSWYEEVSTGVYYWMYWETLTMNDIDAFLNTSSKISASNYKGDSPYVGYITFKNIWGCDRLMNLRTYINKANLLIHYHQFYAQNLRDNNPSYNKYTPFFDQGYFIPNVKEDEGVRLIMGESFNNDELLGENKLNHYFSVGERQHNLPSGWNYSGDSDCQTYFPGITISYPFDHFYLFSPNKALPFFKEKIFEDGYICLNLLKVDKIGNIYRRIVNLPMKITFFNNLIKAYGNPIGTSWLNEYAYSSSEYQFTAPKTSGGETVDHINCTTKIWCPDTSKLNVTSTIIFLQSTTCEITQIPELRNKNGQLCDLYWQFKVSDLSVGNKLKATHKLEFSDGSNYDIFYYTEVITITAS